ncbi:hypothetical protein OH77DRAFT_1421546 [Trametes cingulata]|nr:hypothetical protein OH77DRAFT_1421546 [Trametes cingulata]
MDDALLPGTVFGWYRTPGAALALTLDVLACGLLLYRCWVVLQDTRVTAVLGFLYLGAYTAALGSLYAAPNTLPPNAIGVPVLAQALSMAGRASRFWIRPESVDVLVTALLCSRAYYCYHRHLVQARHRPSDGPESDKRWDSFDIEETEATEAAEASDEDSEADLVVECALLYAVLGGAWIASSFIDGETSLCFMAVYLFAWISPQIIIRQPAALPAA